MTYPSTFNMNISEVTRTIGGMVSRIFHRRTTTFDRLKGYKNIRWVKSTMEGASANRWETCPKCGVRFWVKEAMPPTYRVICGTLAYPSRSDQMHRVEAVETDA